MELEKQVVSLELAKRLKELGVKQESAFLWIYRRNQNVDARAWFCVAEDYIRNGTVWDSRQSALTKVEPLIERCIAAFTVAELGEMLPDSFQCWKHVKGRTLRQEGGEVVWNCLTDESTTNGQGTVMIASTEADARAKMLIYLIEHNVITV